MYYSKWLRTNIKCISGITEFDTSWTVVFSIIAQSQDCFQLSKWLALKPVSLSSRFWQAERVHSRRLVLCVVCVVCSVCCTQSELRAVCFVRVVCGVLCTLRCVGSQCVIWKRVDISIVNQTKQRLCQRCKHRELNLLQFTARSSSANLPVWEESNLHWFTASAFHAELLQWVSFAYKDLKTVATFLQGLQFYRRTMFQHSSTFSRRYTKTIFKYIQAHC